MGKPAGCCRRSAPDNQYSWMVRICRCHAWILHQFLGYINESMAAAVGCTVCQQYGSRGSVRHAWRPDRLGEGGPLVRLCRSCCLLAALLLHSGGLRSKHPAAFIERHPIRCGDCSLCPTVCHPADTCSCQSRCGDIRTQFGRRSQSVPGARACRDTEQLPGHHRRCMGICHSLCT